MFIVLINIYGSECRAVNRIEAHILNGRRHVDLADIQTVERLVNDYAGAFLDVYRVAVGSTLVADDSSSAVENAVGVFLIPLSIAEDTLGVVICGYILGVSPFLSFLVIILIAILLDACYIRCFAVEFDVFE